MNNGSDDPRPPSGSLHPSQDLKGRNLTLIGMPGAGKSTVGMRLADALGAPFLDTDRLIETRWGATLQEIIDSEGLAAFLRREEAVILSLDVRATVIATGGSVVYSWRAMEHLRRSGRVVWLDLPLPVIERRIGAGAGKRGIAKVRDQSLSQLYEERRPLYGRYAHLTVQVQDRRDQDVVEEILVLLNRSGFSWTGTCS
jgi:shikimate kinase